MSAPKPSKRERSVVRVKEPDGTWRELKSDRVMSDDPEINELWELPVAELEKILDDPKHPLYEKAVAVTAQAFAPLQAAVEELLKSPAFDSLVEPIESLVKPIEPLRGTLGPLVPNIDTSWISDLVLEYPAWQEFRRSLPEPARDEPLVAQSIDFDSPTPPTAPLHVVASAATDVALVVLHEISATAREHLAQAKADAASNEEALVVARDSLNVANESLTVARDSRDAARGSRTAGWWAAGAAIAAAVIGIVGIIVTIANAPR